MGGGKIPRWNTRFCAKCLKDHGRVSGRWKGPNGRYKRQVACDLEGLARDLDHHTATKNRFFGTLSSVHGRIQYKSIFFLVSFDRHALHCVSCKTWRWAIHLSSEIGSISLQKIGVRIFRLRWSCWRLNSWLAGRGDFLGGYDMTCSLEGIDQWEFCPE
jgi:hypothetical protein